MRHTLYGLTLSALGCTVVEGVAPYPEGPDGRGGRDAAGGAPGDGPGQGGDGGGADGGGGGSGPVAGDDDGGGGGGTGTGGGGGGGGTGTGGGGGSRGDLVPGPAPNPQDRGCPDTWRPDHILWTAGFGGLRGLPVDPLRDGKALVPDSAVVVHRDPAGDGSPPTRLEVSPDGLIGVLRHESADPAVAGAVHIVDLVRGDVARVALPALPAAAGGGAVSAGGMVAVGGGFGVASWPGAGGHGLAAFRLQDPALIDLAPDIQGDQGLTLTAVDGLVVTPTSQRVVALETHGAPGGSALREISLVPGLAPLQRVRDMPLALPWDGVAEALAASGAADTVFVAGGAHVGRVLLDTPDATGGPMVHGALALGFAHERARAVALAGDVSDPMRVFGIFEATPLGPDDPVTLVALAFLSDRQLGVVLWSAALPEGLLPADPARRPALRVTPDGAFVLVASDVPDAPLLAFDAATGDELPRAVAPRPVRDLAVSRGVPRATEVCNGDDDDCDGLADEDFGVLGPCASTGRCAEPAGAIECDGAGWVRCNTSPGGSAYKGLPEACNGLDDDCDGQTDEDVPYEPPARIAVAGVPARAGRPSLVAVTGDEGGSAYAIAWDDDRPDGPGVRLTSYDGALVPQVADAWVAPEGRRPRLAWSGEALAIAWDADGSATLSRLDLASGALLGARAYLGTPGGNTVHGAPALAWLGEGWAAAAAREEGDPSKGDVVLRTFDQDLGNPGDEAAAGLAPVQADPALVATGDGAAVVAAGPSADGTPAGGLLVSTFDGAGVALGVATLSAHPGPLGRVAAAWSGDLHQLGVAYVTEDTGWLYFIQRTLPEPGQVAAFGSTLSLAQGVRGLPAVAWTGGEWVVAFATDEGPWVVHVAAAPSDASRAYLAAAPSGRPADGAALAARPTAGGVEIAIAWTEPGVEDGTALYLAVGAMGCSFAH